MSIGERAGYRLHPRAVDEAFAEDGQPREHYAPVLDALLDRGLEDLSSRTREEVRSRGLTFGAARDGWFTLDPVPRILTPEEWEELQVGIAQRLHALDHFAADVYGEGRILAEGVVPKRVVEGAPRFEPAMRGADYPGPWISVAGLDVVRCADDRFRVIEDQVRMPSGIAYTAAAREVFDTVLDVEPPSRGDPAEGVPMLAAALLAAGTALADEPSIVLVSEGRGSAGWYEHERLGSEMGVPLVGVGDLELRQGGLFARVDGGRLIQVHVAYQRTDEDMPRVLLDACRRGVAACVNAPGAGVADDKGVNAYVEEMVRFYLGEEPLLPAVPTFDLGRPDQREEALERLDELVVKPRGEMGGEGVVLWRDADDRERERTMRAIERNPGGYIAQEFVTLSTHPTVVDGRLEPRHVDLRPYGFLVDGEARIMPGALTRMALRRGSMVVNSGQGGGAKDSWLPA